MSLQKTGLSIVHEIIMVIVLLCSFWINLGVNPQLKLLEGLSSLINKLLAVLQFPYAFWFIPIFVLLFSVMVSFRISGWLGLLSLTLVFVGGIFIENLFSIVLIVMGMILGLFAPVGE